MAKLPDDNEDQVAHVSTVNLLDNSSGRSGRIAMAKRSLDDKDQKRCGCVKTDDIDDLLLGAEVVTTTYDLLVGRCRDGRGERRLMERLEPSGTIATLLSLRRGGEGEQRLSLTSTASSSSNSLS